MNVATAMGVNVDSVHQYGADGDVPSGGMYVILADEMLS